MLQIDNTIVSLDLIDSSFVCDLQKCRGMCCMGGDSGAPVTTDEIDAIESSFPEIRQYLRKEGLLEIEENGLYYVDEEFDKVTALIDKKECAFSYFEGPVLQCAIEKAWKNGHSEIQKPISCHLYPVRVKKYRDFEAVNYHKWDICAPAVHFGKASNTPLYIFLKDPLIKRFGMEWYVQLDFAAKNYKR